MELSILSRCILLHHIKYSNSIGSQSKLKLMFIFILCWFVTFVSSVLPYFGDRAWNYCFLPNIVTATAIFCFVLRLKERSNKVVNEVASATFGIYVIHATMYLQPLIYHKWIRTEQFNDSYFQLLHFVLCVTIQFWVCMTIDFA